MTTARRFLSSTSIPAFTGPVAAASALMLMGACGEPTEPENPLQDAPYDVVTCDALDAPATAAPLQRVAIGSLPTSFGEEVYARVETSDPDVVGYAVVEADGSTAELLAPVHPAGLLEGGEVTLWITDGSSACAPATMSLQAIPASPGELSAIVDLLQGIVDEQAATLEATRADLVDTPLGGQPSALLPLAIVQRALDHPANDASLRAVASGASTDVSAAELDLIDALLGASGVRAALEAAGAGATPLAPREDQIGSSSATGPMRVSALECLPDVVESAERLDACMEAAASAAFEVGNASAELMQDLGTVFTAAALVPQLTVASGILGLTSWIAMTESLRAAALLPSELTALDYEISPLEFREDEARGGSYSSITVTATNRGWDFGIELLQGLLSTAGAASGLDQADLGGLAIDGVVLTLATVPEVSTLLGGSTIEDFRLEPEVFGPVDVGTDSWTTTEVVSGASVELVSHTDFEPRQPGWTTITLRTKTGEFAGQSIAEEEQIFVTDVLVTVSPDEVVVGPDETRTFTVTVSESEHPDSVEIDPSVNLQGQASIAWNGDGTHTVTYTAPLEPQDGSTDLLTVRHTAAGGARAHAETDITATATIRFGGVTIAPVLVCVSGGQEVQLEAAVLGFDPEPAVLWSASAGTISSAGVLTAPNDVEEVTVTATLEGFPTATDSITIPLGGCVCSFTFQVGSNAPYVGQPGDEVSYSSADGVVPGSPNAVWAVQLNSAAGPGVTLGIPTPEVAADTPGTYPLDVAAGSLGYPGGWFYETNPPEGSITFFEYEPHTVLTGEAQATVRDLEDSDLTFQVFAEFQIHRTPEPTGWVRACTIPEEDPS